MSAIQDKIFEFIYGAGLHDATAQRAYPCHKGEEKQLKNNKEAVEIVKGYVDNIIKGTPDDFYDIAMRLVNSFNMFEKTNGMKELFTFGNAQKLINITVKFMYIVSYNNVEMQQLFANCHCPLDRKMGGFVKKELKKLRMYKSLPRDIVTIIDNNLWKKWDGTWSKVSVESYRQYQTVVMYLSKKEGVIPIEYDYIHFK